MQGYLILAWQFDTGIFSVEGLLGELLPGATLTWYAAGTSTPLATYADEALTVANQNPLPCASDGRFPVIWMQEAAYKYVLKDAAGVTLRSRDNIKNPASDAADAIDTLKTDLASTEDGKGASLVGYKQFGANAADRTVLDKARETVSVLDFRTVLDAHDGIAYTRAVASLPLTGGKVVINAGLDDVIETTITDGGRPVEFVMEACRITGPLNGPVFDLQTNGSSLTGAAPGGSIVKLRAQTNAPVMPTATLTMTAGAVIAAAIGSAGSNLRSTPLVQIGASPTQNDAALIATVAGGACTNFAVVAAGSDYVSAPAVTCIGGGECAIKMNEIQHGRLKNITIDMSNIPNAVGVYQYGGWYGVHEGIDVIKTARHPTAIAYLVDSHTLGVPGPTGSYGGAYVNRYTAIVAEVVFVVGHDTSTATTLHFDTLDASNVHIEGSIGLTFTNPVIQGSSGAFFDIVNVDGLYGYGGDIEGSAIVIRARGSCNNIRLEPLSYTASGQVIYGQIGTGWRLDLSKTNSTGEPLWTGGLGSAGIAWQHVGYKAKGRIGLPYGGDVLVAAQNVKITNDAFTQGRLDNRDVGGFVLYMSTSQQLVMARAPAFVGAADADPIVDLIKIAQFDDGGVALLTLPTAAPAAGSKKLWNDAGTVKIAT